MTRLQFQQFVFEHNPRKIELSFAQHMAMHTVPAYGAVAQSLGPKCRIVRCEGEVFADMPDGASKKLAAISAICVGGTPGQLYLPTGERFEAVVSRFAYIAQGDGRVISYSIEFIERASAWLEGDT